MVRTFYNASSFNNDLSTWNTAKVTSFYQTFAGARSFNSPTIKNWNTGNAINMQAMFVANFVFDQGACEYVLISTSAHVDLSDHHSLCLSRHQFMGRVKEYQLFGHVQ